MLASGLRKRAADAIRGSIHAEGDFVSLYQRSDGTLGLADSYDADEDRAYYLERLYKFALRLKDALPEDRFYKLFSRAAAAPTGQTTLDLFD